MKDVDITDDGKMLFLVCFGKNFDSLLFTYNNTPSVFDDEKKINSVDSYSWAGMVSNDYKILAVGGTNGLVEVYNYDEGNS